MPSNDDDATLDHGTRIPPISHAQWTDEVRQVLASFSVPFSQYGLNGDESEKDNLSPILSTVLQNPALARVYFPFADYVLRKSSLHPRHTRILILRVAWLWRFEVEWAQHAAMAVRDHWLTEDEVKHVARGSTDSGWSDVEVLLIIAVNQMHKSSNIDHETWQALSCELSVQQMVDLTFTIGSYVLAGMYMNCFSLPLKEGQKGFKEFQ